MTSAFDSTTATTTSRTRCNGIHITNELDQVPFVVPTYEIVVAQAGTATPAITPDPRNIRADFDPAGTFPQYDPETLQPTGQTYTHVQLQQMLFSLSAHLLEQRNAADATGGGNPS